MFCKFHLYIVLLLVCLIGCNSNAVSNNVITNLNNKSSKTYVENSKTTEVTDISDNKIQVNIAGNKEKLTIRIEIDKENKFGVVEALFNTQKLEKKDLENGIEWNGLIGSSKKDCELTLKTRDNTEHFYKIPFEPLDFEVDEPFEIHRNSDNTLKLSRKYESPDELWISVYGENTGGFKEWADFNEDKRYLIVPKIYATKLKLGEAVLNFDDYHFGDVESQNKQFPVKFVTSYTSKINIKVVP